MSSYLIPFIQTGIANSSNSSNIANTANFANYAGNVTVSNQPNITSVGNLTYLNVDGNIIGNNLSITNNSNIKDLNSNGNINFSGSNISLGSVNNLHISGGTSGYVLQTDGGGNLSWVAQTGGNGGNGNGTVAGTNTEVQYNNAGSFGASAGFTFNNASNTFNVPGNITSTTNNGNLYMTGWSNVTTLTYPSLFFGNIILSPGDLINNTNFNGYAPNGRNYINFNTTIIPRSSGNNFSVRTNEALTNVSISGYTLIGNTNYLVSGNTGYISSDGFNFTTINGVAPANLTFIPNLISNGSNVFCINYVIDTSVGNSKNFQLHSVISSNFSNTYNIYNTSNLITSTTANFLTLSDGSHGAYGNGLYVVGINYSLTINANSTSNLITLFSNNAQTWNTTNIGNSFRIGDLKCYNNTFVALTYETGVNLSVGGYYTGIYTSSDGNNWTKQSIGNIITNPTETGYKFIGNNFAGNFITAGYQKNATVTQYFTGYSNDAITWTTSNVIAPTLLPEGDTFLTGGNKLLTMLPPPQHGTFWMSTNDGISWDRYTGSNLSVFGQCTYYPSTGRLNVGTNLQLQPTRIATYYSNGIISQYASIGNYAFLGGDGGGPANSISGLWIKGS
jgi:hypothetical protein